MRKVPKVANRLIGVIPYSFSIKPHISLDKEHNYLPTWASPKVDVECRSLDRIEALLVWMQPDRPLRPDLNRFEVRVSDDGDTWIERLRW